MTISYNILWFEDNKSSFDVKKRIVKEIVEDYGFHFPEPRNEINGDNLEVIDYSDYDLIIADLNLAGTQGPALIEKIRQSEIYTEVVFYSSDGESAVRTALTAYQIDGAYCAGRENDDFEDRVRKVIKTTIKKVQDLNNMRGLIMAQTSDVDSIMLDIITTVLEHDTNGMRQALTTHIFDSVKSKVNEKKAKFDKLEGSGNISKILSDTLMFDSHQKLLATQFIINNIEHDLTNPHKPDIFTTGYSDTKKKRDLLAHVKEVVEDGKKVLRGKNNVIEFTDDFCSKMRTEVRKHENSLNEIHKLILSLVPKE